MENLPLVSKELNRKLHGSTHPLAAADPAGGAIPNLSF